MEKEELEQLTYLIDKFSTSLGGRVVIQNGHIQDGFYVGVFDNNGKKIKEFSVPCLSDLGKPNHVGVEGSMFKFFEDNL